MEYERSVESVDKVMIGNKEYIVTQTHPILTPEEELVEKIKAKKGIIKILKKHYENKAS